MYKFYALILMIIFGLVSSICRAENQNDTLATDKKIDKIDAKIDNVYELQKKMYKEIKNEPLANKKYGIEVNIFQLLFLDEAFILSGGFSLFAVNRHAEIAFPIYYSNPEDTESVNELTIDCHYRYFLGNTQNGFYLSGFSRYAHLSGYSGDNDLHLFTSDSLAKWESANKVGIGIGLGYRKFSYRGLYWGISLSLGRYIIGENDRFHGGFLAIDNDGKTVFDMELLKFGWAF